MPRLISVSDAAIVSRCSLLCAGTHSGRAIRLRPAGHCTCGPSRCCRRTTSRCSPTISGAPTPAAPPYPRGYAAAVLPLLPVCRAACRLRRDKTQWSSHACRSESGNAARYKTTQQKVARTCNHKASQSHDGNPCTALVRNMNSSVHCCSWTSTCRRHPAARCRTARAPTRRRRCSA